ncbi:hypothetical protein ES703_60835 [subsurface metagenome]
MNTKTIRKNSWRLKGRCLLLTSLLVRSLVIIGYTKRLLSSMTMGMLRCVVLLTAISVSMASKFEWVKSVLTFAEQKKVLSPQGGLFWGMT